MCGLRTTRCARRRGPPSRRPGRMPPRGPSTFSRRTATPSGKEESPTSYVQNAAVVLSLESWNFYFFSLSPLPLFQWEEGVLLAPPPPAHLRAVLDDKDCQTNTDCSMFSSVKSKYLSDGTEVDLIDVEDNTVVGGKKVQISDTRQCAVGSNQIAGTY